MPPLLGETKTTDLFIRKVNDMISANNISLRVGKKALFEDVNIKFTEGNCYGLIGANGAGKSTFLKILSGQLEPTSGDIAITPGQRLSFLQQDHFKYDEFTVLDTVIMGNKRLYDIMKEKDAIYAKEDFSDEDGIRASELEGEFAEMNGWEAESDAATLLNGLGIETDLHYSQMADLTGSQKVKVLLAQALFGNPDILLLDEPTNHLDMESISWLETYLLNYPGAVFIVSHDRYFLDKVVTKVVEIEAGNMRMYSGNYSAYALKKAQLRDAQYKAYLNQQRDIKHQEAVIAKLKSFNREKSIKRAESREKMLDKVQRIDKPQEIQNQMRISLEPRFVSGNDVLTVESLSKSFPGQTLFSDISFEIKRGERVALIGNNGTGKTTMLKIINGLIDADSGRFTLGSKVQIGYYDQEHHVLHMEKTIFEEISDAYPTLTETEIRNMLAAFLFTGDDVFKLISALSGGERGRVSLAKLMLSEANFLILDEPTNHLDIASKEILEEALNSYTGTVFYVSHDRYFINQTATRILDLTNQAIVNYIGDYDYYLEKKEELTEKYAPAAAQAVTEAKQASDNKLSWQQQKEEQARQRKRENELKKVEARIEELETRDKEIDETMILPDVCTNVAECAKLSKEKAAITEELEGLYEKWEELA